MALFSQDLIRNSAGQRGRPCTCPMRLNTAGLSLQAQTPLWRCAQTPRECVPCLSAACLLVWAHGVTVSGAMVSLPRPTAPGSLTTLLWLRLSGCWPLQAPQPRP